MDDNHWREECEDTPRYKPPSQIDHSALSKALRKLSLLGGDLYLGMQAMNLATVDEFITRLEYDVLQKLIDEERTPGEAAVFLSAQSQMWIFAVYELMRTWRQRASDMIKWAENGGLDHKLAALEKDLGYRHFAREARAGQIRAVLADPSLVEKIRRDLKRTRIVFVRLEAIRICLAKHEVWQKGGSIALSPGYGRINSWCGALDYELENGRYSMGYINRRDIADEIRALAGTDCVPNDTEVEQFEQFMRGNIPLD
jgi:hypothetical protein